MPLLCLQNYTAGHIVSTKLHSRSYSLKQNAQGSYLQL